MKRTANLIRQFTGLCLVAQFLIAGSYAADRVSLDGKQFAQVTVKVVAGGERSSGVVVTEQGHILTTAHGIPLGRDVVRVTTVTDSKLPAEVVKRDQERDLVLLQLKDPPPDLKAAVITPQILPPREPVVATGFPDREQSDSMAILRLGQVERSDDSSIRTTCQLTVGDSGGGLFDVSGRLLGIHQRIGKNRSANLHRSIQSALEAFPQLVNAVKTDDSQRVLKLPQTGSQTQAILKSRTLDLLTNNSPGAVAVCRATLWSSNVAVTKLSRITSGQALWVRTNEGRFISAELEASKRSVDLAVLRLAEPIRSEGVKNHVARRWMYVARKASSQPGLIGRVSIAVASKRAVMGCTFSETTEGLKVARVKANSAAQKAGLRIGDVLITFNEKQISDLESLGEQFETLQPGDRVPVVLKQADTLRPTALRLQHDPAELLQRADFLDGAAPLLSERRTGFHEVFQHDMPLTPDQMGSPVLTIDGRMLGVNIAVAGRERVLAVPSRTVAELVRQAEQDASH